MGRSMSAISTHTQFHGRVSAARWGRIYDNPFAACRPLIIGTARQFRTDSVPTRVACRCRGVLYKEAEQVTEAIMICSSMDPIATGGAWIMGIGIGNTLARVKFPLNSDYGGGKGSGVGFLIFK